MSSPEKAGHKPQRSDQQDTSGGVPGVRNGCVFTFQDVIVRLSNLSRSVFPVLLVSHGPLTCRSCGLRPRRQSLISHARRPPHLRLFSHVTLVGLGYLVLHPVHFLLANVGYLVCLSVRFLKAGLGFLGVCGVSTGRTCTRGGSVSLSYALPFLPLGPVCLPFTPTSVFERLFLFLRAKRKELEKTTVTTRSGSSSV